jgi:biotin carboxyl carrier protein
MKQFKYSINGNIYHVTVNKVEDTIAEVEVNGTPYKVFMDKPAKTQVITVKRPVQAVTSTVGNAPIMTRPAANASPGGAVSSTDVTRPAQVAASTVRNAPAVMRPTATVASGHAVKSPLPGVIININCNIGDIVKKGQTLFILEAMKMENAIPSDRDGVISEIKIMRGDSVLEGADLVIIK